ncbi:MAG: hypothetical protein HN742_09355 [Lentisphaerae bacterium]|jgi:hypothetical protein|nr:hypothetical protein [Lentisphaerota bacterium]MBT5607445.1 hypothetical protein [Lentisphaerota bacterium]MBT7054128.1 hypothetical protein [Lentisphaerota bacterium]MBT7842068.1 hypothetical protein [Lentisphaerota bacterium]
MSKLKATFSILFLLGSFAAPAAPRPKLEVARVAEPPAIDGRLDDACWARAPQITEFRCGDPEHPTPTQPTVAWVACDDSTLYIAARCSEERMDMVPAYETGPDGSVWRDDCLEVFLMPGGPYYYHFAANLIGTRYDARKDTRPDGSPGVKPASWDGDWTAAAVRAPDHWTMEIAIPFACLELGTNRLRELFLFNLGREQRRLTEFSCWPASGFHKHEEFAVLTGLDLDTARFGLAFRDATIGAGVPGTNRFVATVAEEPQLGSSIAVRARVREFPDGLEKVYSANTVSRIDSTLAVDYRVPLTGGRVAVTVECFDAQDNARTSMSRVFRVPALVEGELDCPVVYQADGVVTVRGRVAVPEAMLPRTRVIMALVDGRRTLRECPVTVEPKTGSICAEMSLSDASPGAYVLELRVTCPLLGDQAGTVAFPFRAIRGPFD